MARAKKDESKVEQVTVDIPDSEETVETVEATQEVESVAETTEEKTDVNAKVGEKDAPVIDVDSVETETPKQKLVRIHPNRNHNCCIGGERYTLVADKEINVPQNVKDILSGETGLLGPINS
jgi:hypothetical protein